MPRFTRVVPVLASTIAVLLSIPGVAAADRFVSVGGSGSACTAEAPCGTFDAAYRAAAPGEVVQVAAGSYGGQQIPSGVAKSAPAVIFSATGGAVTLGALNVSGSHIDVREIATGFVDIEDAASDVTVRNGRGTGIFIGGGSRDIAFFGGSYGNGDPNFAPVKVQGTPAPNGITFDGVVFHDAVRTLEGAHLECLYAADVQNFTVRNSHFRNCAIMDLFITKLSGVDPRGITIENNFFDRTGSHGGALSKGYYALYFNEVINTMADVVVRYNSFYDPISFSSQSFTNTRVVANIGPQTACGAGITFRYNVWTSKTCSATDRQAASGFVDPANYDFHLAANAPALLAGDPAEHPAGDIDGDLRPTGTRSDAGADQRTGAPAPPPIDPGGGGTPSGGGGTPSGGGGTPPGCAACVPASSAGSAGAAPTAAGVLATQRCLSQLDAAASRRITLVDARGRRTRHSRRHRITGSVPCRTSGFVRIQAQRRVAGAWRTGARRTVRVTAAGRFATSFSLRRGARYRLVGRYAPSARAKVLSSRTSTRTLRG